MYDDVVERGGTPAIAAINGYSTAPAPQSGFLGDLLDGVFDIFTAVDTSVPTSVASSVFISLEEWRALPTDLQVELEESVRRDGSVAGSHSESA